MATATATQMTSCRAEPSMPPLSFAREIERAVRTQTLQAGCQVSGVRSFDVVKSLKSKKVEYLPAGPSPADGSTSRRGVSEKPTTSENLTVKRDSLIGPLDLRLTYD